MAENADKEATISVCSVLSFTASKHQENFFTNFLMVFLDNGQPTGNLTFPVFKCQFPHPWVFILSQIPIPGAN